MNFESQEWEKNEIGDEMHVNLFQKKNRVSQKKTKAKQKRKVINAKTEGKIKDAKEALGAETVSKSILTTKISDSLKKIISSPNKDISNKIAVNNKDQKSKKIIRARIKSDVILKSNQLKRMKRNVNLKKKVKRLDSRNTADLSKANKDAKLKANKLAGLNIDNLKKQLAVSLQVGQQKENTLRERMVDKLQAARFRFLNEQMYTSEGKDAQKLFQSDPDAFQAYHRGYRQQVERWPLNPLDTIIAALNKLSKEHVVADFGCGDARLSLSVSQTVHSFDLVATNERVTACDMAHVPLKNGSIDAAVFCLSLMGTNLKDYLLEANRVLKNGGILKIAEVESRFEGVESFIQILHKFGFKNTWQDLSHNLFYFLDFIKERDIKQKNKVPAVSLQPCLYKKR